MSDNPHNYNSDNFSENAIKDACSKCHTLNLDSFSSTDTSFKDSSITCMGCHDGVNAKNMPTIYPKKGKLYGSFGNMSLNSGHPVMVSYVEGVAGLRPKYTSINNWSNASSINDLLRGGKLECGSCHNPHEKKWPKYLKHNNKNSGLCFSCHDK